MNEATAEHEYEDDNPQEERESILKQPDKKLLDRCRETYERVRKLKEERKAINEKITAELSDLEAEGLSKKAVKHVWTYLDLEEDQRRIYDLSMSVVRVAQGLPIQGDLFTDEQVKATQMELVK